jgi:hypothetical protein
VEDEAQEVVEGANLDHVAVQSSRKTAAVAVKKKTFQ